MSCIEEKWLLLVLASMGQETTSSHTGEMVPEHKTLGRSRLWNIARSRVVIEILI